MKRTLKLLFPACFAAASVIAAGLARAEIDVFACEPEWGALVAEIGRAHETGRPVLVGTLTIEESERLADRLRSAGIACDVLNARNDEQEAGICRALGRRLAVIGLSLEET